MDCSKLDKLMSIEKKSDASNAKKEEYCVQLTALLQEEGYSILAENYAFEGFSFVGMTPVIDWMINQSETNEYYTIIREGNAFKKNDNGISFKVALSVLVSLINHNSKDKSDFESIIKDTPHLSYNKEGKRRGHSAKSFEKYFLIPLSSDVPLPDLTSYDVKPAFLKDFILLIGELLNSISLKKDEDVKKALKIRQWVTGSNIMQEYLLSRKDSTVAPVKSDGKKTSKSQFLIETAHYLDELEKERSELKISLEKQSSNYAKAQSEKSFIEEELKKTRNYLAAANEKNDCLESENSRLKSDNQKMDNAILEQDEQISKYKSVLSVFETSKKNSQREQLNLIASKLKGEYRDFKDALNMVMNIELGENMRQQLVEIFKILSKNGIDIESR